MYSHYAAPMYLTASMYIASFYVRCYEYDASDVFS